jgi:hypothetical protein
LIDGCNANWHQAVLFDLLLMDRIDIRQYREQSIRFQWTNDLAGLPCMIASPSNRVDHLLSVNSIDSQGFPSSGPAVRLSDCSKDGKCVSTENSPRQCRGIILDKRLQQRFATIQRSDFKASSRYQQRPQQTTRATPRQHAS